jgi:protein-disulfide isomerase
MTRIAWMALAAVLTVGCGDAETPARTTDTTRSLLAQPRAADVSTEFDASQLAAGEPELGVDMLGMNLGSPEAPVKVIEFVDYGCGYCRKFQEETFAAIRAEFIETSMVEWKFMPFVTGMFRNSAVVTEAAECALDEDARLFAVVSSRLWAQQADWKASGEPEALLRDWITQVGGDGPAFDTCMQDHRRLPRVTSATALAAELGVRSTPTFWIVGAGPVQGALPLEIFRQVLSQAYQELSQAAG